MDIDEDIYNYDDEGDDVPLAPTAPTGPLDQYQQLHAILRRMGTNMTVNQAHIEYCFKRLERTLGIDQSSNHFVICDKKRGHF